MSAFMTGSYILSDQLPSLGLQPFRSFQHVILILLFTKLSLYIPTDMTATMHFYVYKSLNVKIASLSWQHQFLKSKYIYKNL